MDAGGCICRLERRKCGQSCFLEALCDYESGVEACPARCQGRACTCGTTIRPEQACVIEGICKDISRATSDKASRGKREALLILRTFVN